MTDLEDKPSIDDVRRAIGESLGDDRVSSVETDRPLLRSGIITSIELVSLIVDLEKRFSVSIPDGAIHAESVTLQILAGLVGVAGAPEGTAAAPKVGGTRSGLARYLRRPLEVAAFAFCAFFAVDRAVDAVLLRAFARDYDQFLEHGERLYPWSGAFAQDDFAFAVGHHRVKTEPRAGETTILFFGDSGTIGSYFGTEASIPSRTEHHLLAEKVDARVMNLAWFGRLLPKDLMLLEAVWDRPFEVAVFTIGDDYFSKDKVDLWIKEYRHCSVNLPLFRAFLGRVPETERAPFLRVEEKLARADRAHYGPFRRFGFEHVALMRHRPFLQWVLRERLLPDLFFSTLRWDQRFTQKTRYFEKASVVTERPGLLAAAIDVDQIQILESTIRLLAKRGVKTVLYVEPFGPANWPHQTSPDKKTALDIAEEIAGRTGAHVIDQTWSVDQKEFLDSDAHYVPEANDRIGAALATRLGPIAGRGAR